MCAHRSTLWVSEHQHTQCKECGCVWNDDQYGNQAWPASFVHRDNVRIHEAELKRVSLAVSSTGRGMSTSDSMVRGIGMTEEGDESLILAVYGGDVHHIVLNEDQEEDLFQFLLGRHEGRESFKRGDHL